MAEDGCYNKGAVLDVVGTDKNSAEDDNGGLPRSKAMLTYLMEEGFDGAWLPGLFTPLARTKDGRDGAGLRHPETSTPSPAAQRRPARLSLRPSAGGASPLASSHGHGAPCGPVGRQSPDRPGLSERRGGPAAAQARRRAGIGPGASFGVCQGGMQVPFPFLW